MQRVSKSNSKEETGWRRRGLILRSKATNSQKKRDKRAAPKIRKDLKGGKPAGGVG